MNDANRELTKLHIHSLTAQQMQVRVYSRQLHIEHIHVELPRATTINSVNSLFSFYCHVHPNFKLTAPLADVSLKELVNFTSQNSFASVTFDVGSLLIPKRVIGNQCMMPETLLTRKENYAMISCKSDDDGSNHEIEYEETTSTRRTSKTLKLRAHCIKYLHSESSFDLVNNGAVSCRWMGIALKVSGNCAFYETY